MIVSWFRQRKSIKSAAAGLYQAVVAQSRDPRFYTELGVSDTLDGRFDLVSMHVFLIIARLRQEKGGCKLGQALFDCMFRSMDDTLREIGVGDLSVPKHMHKMMKAFNGRAHTYFAAINDNNFESLEQAVIRNIYRTEGDGVPAAAHQMADYVSLASDSLRMQDFQALSAGHVSFPSIPYYEEARA